jgi:hypothetical protein
VGVVYNGISVQIQDKFGKPLAGQELNGDSQKKEEVILQPGERIIGVSGFINAKHEFEDLQFIIGWMATERDKKCTIF